VSRQTSVEATVANTRPPEWPVLIGFYAGVVVLVILPQVR